MIYDSFDAWWNSDESPRKAIMAEGADGWDIVQWSSRLREAWLAGIHCLAKKKGLLDS